MSKNRDKQPREREQSTGVASLGNADILITGDNPSDKPVKFEPLEFGNNAECKGWIFPKPGQSILGEKRSQPFYTEEWIRKGQPQQPNTWHFRSNHI